MQTPRMLLQWQVQLQTPAIELNMLGLPFAALDIFPMPCPVLSVIESSSASLLAIEANSPGGGGEGSQSEAAGIVMARWGH